MRKCYQFLSELSAHDTSIFSFQDNNLHKYQRIFNNLDICINIVEIWIGIAIGYISSISTEFSPHDTMVGYYRFTFYSLL